MVNQLLPLDLQQLAVCRGHFPLHSRLNARSTWPRENENRSIPRLRLRVKQRSLASLGRNQTTYPYNLRKKTTNPRLVVQRGLWPQPNYLYYKRSISLCGAKIFTDESFLATKRPKRHKYRMFRIAVSFSYYTARG